MYSFLTTYVFNTFRGVQLLNTYVFNPKKSKNGLYTAWSILKIFLPLLKFTVYFSTRQFFLTRLRAAAHYTTLPMMLVEKNPEELPRSAFASTVTA
jgi:hypothetical protein